MRRFCDEKVRRSSISERLSKMDPDYFRQMYACSYDQFSELYSFTQRNKYNLIRVDSSMVSESVGKLMEVLDNKSGQKYYREELVDTPFRLVVVKSMAEDQKEYWLLTNDFKRSAKEISQAYTRR